MVDITLTELLTDPPLPSANGFTIAAVDASPEVERANIVDIAVNITLAGETMATLLTRLPNGETATVCLPVSDNVRTAAAGAPLILLHYVGSAWNALPMSMFDDDRARVCGVTNSFSPFAVGFRLAVPEEAAKQWQARFGRTVATQAVDAIGGRFRSAARPVSQMTLGGRTLSLAPSAGGGQGEAPISRLAPGLTGGQSSPWSAPGALDDGGAGASHDGLWGSEDQAEPSSMSGRELLRGARFTLALGGDGRDAMGAGAHGVWTAWGRSVVGGFDGKSDTGQSVDGKVLTGYLGFDYAISDVLTGFAISYSKSGGDFTDTGSQVSNEMDASLTSLYPYVHWTSGTGQEFWGLLGYGLGDLEFKDAANRTQGDIEMRMAALGGRWSLPSTGEFRPALKTDVLAVQTVSDGALAAESSVQRLRLSLDVQTVRVELGDFQLSPNFELGMRFDGGDAASGVGIEIGGGLVFANPRRGVKVEARGRVLMAHQEEDFKEWGASVSGQYGKGPDGRGLSLSLIPVWGNASSAVDALWGSEAGGLPGAGGASSQRSPSAMPDRVDLELGYAMATRGLFTLGAQPGRSRLLGAVLTPYGSLSLSDGRTNRLREGLRWTIPGLDTRLDLFGEHSLGAREQAGHRIGLTGSVRF